MDSLKPSEYGSKHEINLRIQKVEENYNSYNRFYMNTVYMNYSGRRTRERVGG
jgi:hypothetical protein